LVIYPNDHRPAHVHAVGHGCEAVFDLNCWGGPAELRENYGFPRREVGQIMRSLAEHMDLLCRACEQIHGIA